MCEVEWKSCYGSTVTCVGYYRCLRCLAESRLPSCIEQSDTAAPPSALADTVFMLMTRPLTLDADITSAFSYVSAFQFDASPLCSSHCKEIWSFFVARLPL